MGKPRAKWSGKDQHPFEDNPIVDDFLDWMGSSEGQDSIEALDVVFGALDHVDVDARRRKIIWPDGKRLSIEESATSPCRASGYVPQPDRNSRVRLVGKLRARVLHRPTDGGIRPAHAAVA
jgi:hypothetical protein